jgi:hypothetical protein
MLEKIFFEVLNKPSAQRKAELREIFDRVPYLNGGLFDPHVDDYYESGPNWALKLPDQWFKDLFEILETYNFTIDENTATDVDLSIDPEMLGRIFENLLAEINPETGKSARKSTGSYYTPRPIVEYMVDQSLEQYLINKTGISEDKIKAIVSADETDDEEWPLTPDDKHKIVDALDALKILDPACGSGAFPIGILQKIVLMLGRIDRNGVLWFEKKTENLDPILKTDFTKKFENENFDYIRKTGIIKDSIYGVDTQPIAVEVSKLRCFLTLIVDEDIDDSSDNRGIKPLPNLEFKFVAANTLIELPGSTSSTKQVGMFEEDAEIEQLKKLRDLYFISNGFEKEKIKSRFKDIQKEMFKKQISKGGHGKMTMALADWNPFSDDASSWFDPGWMFGVDEFDIAIANPPYVRVDDIDAAHKDVYKKTYETASGKYDLYYLFYEKSLQLLSKGGVCIFISPNKFCASDSGLRLRSLMVNECSIKEIASVSNVKVFEDASNYPVIITLINSSGIETLVKKVSSIESISQIESSSYRATASELKEFPNLTIPINTSQEKFDMVKRLYSSGKFLSDIFSISEGLRIPEKYETTGSEGVEIVKQFQFERYSQIRPAAVITRSNLSKVITEKSDRYKKIMVQKILIAEDGLRINATIDKKLMIPQGGVYFGIVTDPSYDISFVLGLLNSKLLSKIYELMFSGMHMGGGYLRYRSKFLEGLPLPSLSNPGDRDLMESVSELAAKILDGPVNDKIEAQIDELVFRLYGLSSEEVGIVEPS